MMAEFEYGEGTCTSNAGNFMVAEFEPGEPCTSDTGNFMVAEFELMSITCVNGTYLPANATTCSPCPNGYTCPGGTFEFDALNDQGKGCSVTYSCGGGIGTIPIDATVYQSGTTVTTVSAENNTCTAPTGKVLKGWSCDGVMVSPGYAFTISENTTCIAQWLCVSSGFDLNTLAPSTNCDYGSSHNYSWCYSQSCEWTSYPCPYGYVSGEMYCSSRSGNHNDTTWTNDSSNWTATDEQVKAEEGQYCWCRVTSVDGLGVASSSWVYRKDRGSLNECINECSGDCGYGIQHYENGRRALYGTYITSFSTTAQSCPVGYSVTYDCGGGIGTIPIDATEYVNGATVITLSNTCTKPDNTFTGWSCDGNNVTAGSTFTISGNTTCTAQWSECDACATTNASCLLSVENNTCKYTTSCLDGYNTIQDDGTYNASCLPNTITITWNGATAEDISANNAGSVSYGGDIRTPRVADSTQIPIGKTFVGWKFAKPSQ